MVKKWEIYFLNFNPITGSEQAGIRPALVISTDIVNRRLPVFTVIPLSSIQKGDIIYPYEVELPKSTTGLPKDSVALVYQMRTISTERVFLASKSGLITEQKIKDNINQAIIEFFELD
jgi:mRNA interferase MazF